MIIKCFLDPGTAIGRQEEVLDTNDWGITDDDWNAMTYEEKEEHVREWKDEHIDWGWYEEDELEEREKMQVLSYRSKQNKD
jgi:hypothetical protein